MRGRRAPAETWRAGVGRAMYQRGQPQRPAHQVRSCRLYRPLERRRGLIGDLGMAQSRTERSEKNMGITTGSTVSCPRCGGLMAREPAAEIDPEMLRWRLGDWRCLICGNHRDPQTDCNRALADPGPCQQGSPEPSPQMKGPRL